MTNIDSLLKSRHYFANKDLSSQSCGFSSSHVWMWELDHKESWVLKNWCFWTVVLEKTLESPLDCKEIHPVHPKGNQSWVFIGRTDAEAETPILWPPDAKNWVIGKDPDAGKDWKQEKKGMTEDGHEFEQALGFGDGQGSLAYCSPWGRKESDTLSNWTELMNTSDHGSLGTASVAVALKCYKACTWLEFGTRTWNHGDVLDSASQAFQWTRTIWRTFKMRISGP